MPGLRRTESSGEQNGRATVVRHLRHINAAACPGQPDVGHDKIDLRASDREFGVGAAISRVDDFISGMGQHMFIFDCDQWFVLDIQYFANDSLPMSEKHFRPVSFASPVLSPPTP